MTAQTHTPGPWEWDEVPLPGAEPMPDDPRPTAWPLNAANGSCVLRHRAPWAIAEADKALLKAAPALLAAAQMAAEWIDTLMLAVGGKAVIDAMPNNCGGRLQLREAIELVIGERGSQ